MRTRDQARRQAVIIRFTDHDVEMCEDAPIEGRYYDLRFPVSDNEAVYKPYRKPNVEKRADLTDVPPY